MGTGREHVAGADRDPAPARLPRGDRVRAPLRVLPAPRRTPGLLHPQGDRVGAARVRQDRARAGTDIRTLPRGPAVTPVRPRGPPAPLTASRGRPPWTRR